MRVAAATAKNYMKTRTIARSAIRSAWQLRYSSICCAQFGTGTFILLTPINLDIPQTHHVNLIHCGCIYSNSLHSCSDHICVCVQYAVPSTSISCLTLQWYRSGTKLTRTWWVVIPVCSGSTLTAMPWLPRQSTAPQMSPIIVRNVEKRPPPRAGWQPSGRQKMKCARHSQRSLALPTTCSQWRSTSKQIISSSCCLFGKVVKIDTSCSAVCPSCSLIYELVVLTRSGFKDVTMHAFGLRGQKAHVSCSSDFMWLHPP